MTQNTLENRIRILSADDNPVTDLKIATFSNGDFIVVTEQLINALYYLCITKYNSNFVPIIPSFYVKNAEGINSTPRDINVETANLFASSCQPMNPSVAALQNNEFVVAFFQMPYRSITLKKFGTNGYAQNLYASNDALGQYPTGDIQSWDINNLPDNIHWEENVAMSLSLLGFNDNRFLVAWATNFWPLPCKPIGLPLPVTRLECEKGDAPYKASVSISTYNSDGSLFDKQKIISKVQGQDENVDFYTSTALRMLDVTNDFFIVAYYLEQELVARTCRYDLNTVLQCDELYFDKSVLTSRPFVQIGLYPFSSNVLPIFFYESINRLHSNIQSFMSVRLANGYVKSTLIGDDNTQGQYNDRDPNKCVLPNGVIMVTWHRYNAKDDTNLGLFVQSYTFSVTPTDLIVTRVSAPQCFDNTEHSLGPFTGGNNVVNCIVESGAPYPYFYALDPTQGVVYFSGQCTPSESSILGDAAIGNRSINYAYAVATLMLAIFTVTVVLRLVFLHSRRIFFYQRLSDNANEGMDIELSTVHRTNRIRSMNNNEFLANLFGRFFNSSQPIPLGNQHRANKNYQSISEVKL